jgi:hypothetical protein
MKKQEEDEEEEHKEARRKRKSRKKKRTRTRKVIPSELPSELSPPKLVRRMEYAT